MKKIFMKFVALVRFVRPRVCHKITRYACVTFDDVSDIVVLQHTMIVHDRRDQQENRRRICLIYLPVRRRKPTKQ
jgi:uncharacterized DUF497 family protein